MPSVWFVQNINKSYKGEGSIDPYDDNDNYHSYSVSEIINSNKRTNTNKLFNNNVCLNSNKHSNKYSNPNKHSNWNQSNSNKNPHSSNNSKKPNYYEGLLNDE
jgi:hypothetical protein